MQGYDERIEIIKKAAKEAQDPDGELNFEVELKRINEELLGWD